MSVAPADEEQYCRKNSNNSSLTVHQEMNAQEQSILLQRSQSRVKQVEFELAVSQQVSSTLKQQLREAQSRIESLEAQLNGTGIVQLKEAGLNQLLEVSQKKLKKQQRDGEYQGEILDSLKSDLKKARTRMRELELERACLIEKMDECLCMIESPEEDLHRKVLQIPQLNKQIASLKGRLEDRDKEAKEMKEASKLNTAMIDELTKLLSPELSARELNDTIKCLKEGRELSTEKAQLLTISHLKSQVEKLEDEKAFFRERIAYLNKQVEDASMADGGGGRPVGATNIRSSISSVTSSLRSMLSNDSLEK